MRQMLVAGVVGWIVLLGNLDTASAQYPPGYDATAVQCAELTADQASRAANLLTRDSKVLWYCPQCGDKTTSAWSRIDTLSVVGSGDTKRRIQINGSPAAIDLAYLFYLSRDGAAHNAARSVGCPTRDVPASVVGPMSPLRKYTLDLVIDVAATKANGWEWDAGKREPDPLVRGGLYRGGKQVQALRCGSQSTFRLSCLNGTQVTANAETVLWVVIQDTDSLDNDDIGEVAGRLESAIGQAGRFVKPVSVAGQIKAAWLKLTPLR